MIWVFTVCLLSLMVAVVWGFAHPTVTYFAQENQLPFTLITTHLSHLNTQHLSNNIIAYVLLVYLFPSSSVSIAKASALCVLLVGVMTHAVGVDSILGLSALLYCLPGIACAQYVTTSRYDRAMLIVTIMALYFTIIQNPDATPWPSANWAHLLGFVSGFFVSLQSNQRSQENFVDKRQYFW